MDTHLQQFVSALRLRLTNPHFDYQAEHISRDLFGDGIPLGSKWYHDEVLLATFNILDHSFEHCSVAATHPITKKTVVKHDVVRARNGLLYPYPVHVHKNATRLLLDRAASCAAGLRYGHRLTVVTYNKPLEYVFRALNVLDTLYLHSYEEKSEWWAPAGMLLRMFKIEPVISFHYHSVSVSEHYFQSRHDRAIAILS